MFNFYWLMNICYSNSSNFYLCSVKTLYSAKRWSFWSDLNFPPMQIYYLLHFSCTHSFKVIRVFKMSSLLIRFDLKKTWVSYVIGLLVGWDLYAQLFLSRLDKPFNSISIPVNQIHTSQIQFLSRDTEPDLYFYYSFEEYC